MIQGLAQRRFAASRDHRAALAHRGRLSHSGRRACTHTEPCASCLRFQPHPCPWPVVIVRTERTPPLLLRAVVLAVALLWSLVPIVQAAHHVDHGHAIAGDGIVHVGCDHDPVSADIEHEAPASPTWVALTAGDVSPSVCSLSPIPARGHEAPSFDVEMRMVALPSLAPRPPPSTRPLTMVRWQIPPATGPPVESARA